MSTWRDIWRYGVIANRLFAENEEQGKTAFDKLSKVYDKPEKDGKDRRDGMIRYILGEAHEYKYKKTNDIKYKNNALEFYKEAENLFPVDHWKEVARKTYTRLDTSTSAENFFNIKNDSPCEKVDIYFENLLWYGFQKTYDFVYLNDFARYVCLSWERNLNAIFTLLEIS